jgi:Mn2+/Fe2+ NRAMP family transporter
MSARGLSPFLAVVPVAMMCALVALAHATPPDQTWRGGIYDDADLDDVVLIVTAQVGLAGVAGFALFIVLLLADGLRREIVGGRSAAPACFESSRAPPASRPFA